MRISIDGWSVSSATCGTSRSSRARDLEMYLPIRQTGDYSSVDLVVRTTLPPAGLPRPFAPRSSPLNRTCPAMISNIAATR